MKTDVLPTEVEKTVKPLPLSLTHTHTLALSAKPLWRFYWCTTNILVQHSLRVCRKATVTKQQSLGGRQSYRHGDPHSFGLELSFFRRSRPSRALPAEERRHQHNINTASAQLDSFSPLHSVTATLDPRLTSAGRSPSHVSTMLLKGYNYYTTDDGEGTKSARETQCEYNIGW